MLTDIKCRTTKPKDKPYKVFDGGGLYLEVMPNGSKLWRLKYRYLNKEKRMSLGRYPLITLSEARDERDKAKKMILKIIDPSASRKDVKRTAIRNAQNSFKAIALDWWENNKDTWSEGYSKKVLNGLELNVFPFIGYRPIVEITPPEVLSECLMRIQKRGSLDIAGRTRYIIGQIFRYAIQRGLCNWNAAENLKGALKKHRKEHYRTIDAKEIPNFLKALKFNECRLYERTRRAVWLSLYTFCRPVEIRSARWCDIDFEEKLWTIPAERMKMKRAHIVPLSKQAIEVLQEQKKETGRVNTEWVFPSQVHPRNPMSDGTVTKAIKNLGYGKEMVAHGFRALARTTIREKLRYDSEIIEKQLAHLTNNPLGEAYDRTRFIDDRIEMMQKWADYVDAL